MHDMNPQKVAFSVVTPNLNMARFLPQTIESVLDNLGSDDEYIVIDGGSTDGSVDIITKYAKHLTMWVSEPDRGQADAVGKGFRWATGGLLCWINSGDMLLRGALPAARNSLTETGADLIFGDDAYIDEEHRVIQHSCGKVLSLKASMLYGGWTPLQDACFWRRSIYSIVGGINPEPRVALDYDFFLRASVAGKCRYIPKVFSAFRRHKGQLSLSRKEAYEMERRLSRKRVRAKLGIGRIKWTVLSAMYYFILRFNVHVTNRFRRSRLPLGADIRTLAVR